MSYPGLASDDHEILGSEYCSGYTDVYGKWNTGFYCPQTPANTAGFCCGTTVFKYCCTTKAQSSSESEELHSAFKQIPIVIGIACGVMAMALSVIIASCYFCSCCVVYKKRRAHLPGGIYRLQGSSSTVSGLGNIYSSASHHNSLVTTPLGLDTEWHQTMLSGPPQLSTATNSLPVNPQVYNFGNNGRLQPNQFNNLNLYSSFTNSPAPHLNGAPNNGYAPFNTNSLISDGYSPTYNPNTNNPSRNYYPNLATLNRQNQIHNLSQAILQSRGQNQIGNYRGENGYSSIRPQSQNQYLIQQRVNPGPRVPTPTNYSQSNIRTNNKPLFYQTQSQMLALQSNRHHYHQTLANSIIMRANQYQRILNGSMSRSMSLSNANHNPRRENIACGSSPHPESAAQAINTNTLTSSSTSTDPLALEAPLTNTNGVAECGFSETIGNITISSEPINPDPSNEITNGPPTTILSPSTSTSLTLQMQSNASPADDTTRKMSSNAPAPELVELKTDNISTAEKKNSDCDAPSKGEETEENKENEFTSTQI